MKKKIQKTDIIRLSTTDFNIPTKKSCFNQFPDTPNMPKSTRKRCGRSDILDTWSHHCKCGWAFSVKTGCADPKEHARAYLIKRLHDKKCPVGGVQDEEATKKAGAQATIHAGSKRSNHHYTTTYADHDGEYLSQRTKSSGLNLEQLIEAIQESPKVRDRYCDGLAAVDFNCKIPRKGGGEGLPIGLPHPHEGDRGIKLGGIPAKMEGKRKENRRGQGKKRKRTLPPRAPTLPPKP